MRKLLVRKEMTNGAKKATAPMVLRKTVTCAAAAALVLCLATAANVAFAAEDDGAEAPLISVPGAEGETAASGAQGTDDSVDASGGASAQGGTSNSESASEGDDASSEGNDSSAGEEAGQSGEGEASANGQAEVQEQEEQQEQPQIDPDNRVNPQQMPDSSFLYDTSIAELADADPYMNNQTVQIVGEAIGDILNAADDPNCVWVMLQEKVDNDYPQISVFMTRSQADLIDHLGRYGVQGTKLQVRGEFHLACPQHEGLTDLHAESVSVVSRGSVTPQTFDVQQFVPGAVLFVVAGALLLVFRRLQEGQR